MASLAASLRSESERSVLGAQRLDTVADRLQPGWPAFIDDLMTARRRSADGTVIVGEKPPGSVRALIEGVTGVVGRPEGLRRDRDRLRFG